LHPHLHATNRRKWKRWFRKIESQVQELVYDDHLFRKSMECAMNGGRIGPNNSVYRWTIRAYGNLAAVGIRRVLDRNEATYSLRVLLRKLANNPQVISRRSFVAGYASFLKEKAHADFDALAGPGAPHLPASIPQRDLRRLDRMEARIKRLVDKFIAHRDRKQRNWRHNTYQELRQAITELDELCRRYLLILFHTGRDSLLEGHITKIDGDCEKLWG
jgi:hypothetical protein